jgi:hypothetical protein
MGGPGGGVIMTVSEIFSLIGYGSTDLQLDTSTEITKFN